MTKAPKKRETTRLPRKKRKATGSTHAAPKRSVDKLEALARARGLFDVVKILEVHMVGCRAHLRAEPQGTLHLGVRRIARGTRSPDESQLCAQVQCTLEGKTDGSSGKEAILLIEATFHAVYEVPPETAADELTLELFAQTNGTFNVWPYWREFVQSISARMGLPVLTVPSYRIEEAFSDCVTGGPARRR